MLFLSASIGKQIAHETLEAWFLILGDLSPEQLQRGIVETLRTHEFGGMPAVGLIRKNASVGMQAIGIDDRAVVAWSSVKSAVATHGAYATVDFDDPIINAVIRSLGGWVRICDTPSGEAFDTWLRKDFERCYETLCKTGVEARLAAPVAGIIDTANSATGYDDRCLPLVIETGLPRHGQKLIRGTIPEPTRIGDATKRLALSFTAEQIGRAHV